MFGIGEAIGKLVAAPFRILDIPNRIFSAMFDDDADSQPLSLEKIAQALEDQTKRIIGD